MGVITTVCTEHVGGVQLDRKLKCLITSLMLIIAFQKLTLIYTVFFVRIFNPFAQSYANSSMSKCYRKGELDKKREYEDE